MEAEKEAAEIMAVLETLPEDQRAWEAVVVHLPSGTTVRHPSVGDFFDWSLRYSIWRIGMRIDLAGARCGHWDMHVDLDERGDGDTNIVPDVFQPILDGVQLHPNIWNDPTDGRYRMRQRWRNGGVSLCPTTILVVREPPETPYCADWPPETPYCADWEVPIVETAAYNKEARKVLLSRSDIYPIDVAKVGSNKTKNYAVITAQKRNAPTLNGWEWKYLLSDFNIGFPDNMELWRTSSEKEYKGLVDPFDFDPFAYDIGMP